MKHLIITLLAFVSVTASLAQTHTFTYEGRSITVNVSSTIDTYYNESLNGSWSCIPVVLEYAAEKVNLSKAQYLYGMSYMQGIDRDRDIDKGMMWLKKAADQGEKEAANELGTYYEDFGQYQAAETYLLKASRLGANYAYYNLGHLYMSLDKSELAEKYFNLAIDYGPMGQIDSIHNLNVLLARQMRIKDSIVILRKGAENYNDPYSQVYLGQILYFFGSNCDNRPSQKDKEEGKRWIEKAAASGDSRAIQILSEIK